MSKLILHDEIKSPLQRAVQAAEITLFVRFRHTRVRTGNLLALARILRRSIDSLLGVTDEHLRLIGRVRLGSANEQLVVPRVGRIGVVLADVPRGRVTLLDLALPVFVGGRPPLEVEVLGEGQGEPLVQPALVEVVGFFERVQVAGDLRRAGENHACIDRVCRFHDRVDGRGGVGGGCRRRGVAAADQRRLFLLATFAHGSCIFMHWSVLVYLGGWNHVRSTDAMRRAPLGPEDISGVWTTCRRLEIED